MNLTALLGELGARMGMTDLGLDDTGCCTLCFDDEHEVTFTEDSGDSSILMFGEVGEADNLDRLACRELLEASLLGAETGGGALSVDRDSNKVILWKRFEGEMPNVSAFENAVNGFLPQVIAWKERLAAAALAAGKKSPSDPGDFNAFGLRV